MPEPDLFEAAVMRTPTRTLRGLVRGTDPIESQGAAARQLEGRSALQARLLVILATEQPYTAKELEARREFATLGPSTVRKRLSELHQSHHVTKVGRRDGCAVWDVTELTDLLHDLMPKAS